MGSTMVETTTTTTTTTSSCWSSIVQKQPPPKQQQADASQVFESCKSSKGIAVAVVDANAIIQGGENLRNSADKFVWVSEVADEVKDATSRRKLTLAPFTVEAMEPSTEALKKVINFARATGDLQTLSDVDLKLIALTYTLEAQIHGTNHLRDTPPPVHMLNVKRMSEKEMPGWGSNVPNLDEWEALEHAVEAGSNSDSRILPLKDLNLNLMPIDGPTNSEHGGGVIETVTEAHAEDQEDVGRNVRLSRRYAPVKKEINLEGKKMVADGIDASQGQDDNDTDWLPAVSRSTHRRFLRRKARRELSEASSEMNDYPDEQTNMETNFVEDTRSPDLMLPESSEGAEVVEEMSEEGDAMEGKIGDGDLASILKNMRLEADSLDVLQDGELSMSSVDASDSVEAKTESADITFETDVNETCNEGLANMDTSSNTNESVDASFVDDNSSEQSWMLRSMSESSVACITSDFAMQNVILQIGLRLLAPGGMQIRKLHRWILKCHACNKVTAEIGRIFCPKCGNGGTLRRVAVTVGENGITLAARRPRITLRGTKFSLPMPQGGRDAITKNMILREDQLPHKLLYPKKKKSNKQGEDDDIFIRDDVFCHTSDKRTSFKPPVRKALAVFSGKRNPNDNHFSRAKH